MPGQPYAATARRRRAILETKYQSRGGAAAGGWKSGLCLSHSVAPIPASPLQVGSEHVRAAICCRRVLLACEMMFFQNVLVQDVCLL